MFNKTRISQLKVTQANPFPVYVTQRAIVVAGLLFLLPGVAMSLSSDIPDFTNRQLPSITARYVELKFPEKKVLAQARFELSPQGMRLIRGTSPWRIMLVRNFLHNRTWLIDQGRALIHEPIYAEDDDVSLAGPQRYKEKKTVTTRLNNPIGDAGTGFLSGFPCKDASRVSRGHDKRWRGQQLSQWICKTANHELLAVDYYSESWGLVVRSVSVGNVVRELHGIQSVKYRPGHFEPNRDYTSVDLSELVNGLKDVKRYVE